MNTQSLRLDTIIFDAGTQIRAAISEDVVSQYAERMTDGDVFPPVVVFHDGNQYYMADGFHRGLAAKRNDFRDIDAEVRAGTKIDALWFALGANRVNGYRLTVADKRHAILLALETWPDKSQVMIASQIGVNQSSVQRVRQEVMRTHNLPDRVTGKDGKSYPASRSVPPVVDPKRQAVARMVKDGAPSKAIKTALGVRSEVVADVRRELGVGSVDKSKAAVQQRLDRMRELAASGHTVRQIAVDVGMSNESCRTVLRKAGIDRPADRVTSGLHRHDANRIVSVMVMDAEHLTADVNLVEFKRLDREQLGGWIHSLIASRKALEAFIRRLKQEYEKHGQAA